jgi:PAS domain S-box-containing protein
VIFGQTLLNVGITKFLNRKKTPWISISIYFAFLIVYFYFIFLDDSMFGRAAAVSASTGFISINSSYVIFRKKRTPFSCSAFFTASAFLLYGLFQIFTTAAVFFLPPIMSYNDLNQSSIRTIAFVVPIVTSILWTFGFIIMVNQRLNSENQEEKEKWKSIFNLSNDAKVILRMSDAMVVDINVGFSIMTGYTRQDLIGRSLLSINLWDSDRDREATIAQLIDTGVVKDKESVFRRKDGSQFVGVISSSLVFIDDEPHSVSVVHDITESVAAERAIRSLLAEKELILKEVHHRIKNNMSTIYSLLSLQAETLTDAASISALKDARNRIQSMMGLYSKLYKSSHFNKLPINDYLPSLIDDIVENSVKTGEVAVEKHIDSFVLPVAHLQPIGMIINELLTNIMKYAFTGRDDGVITVTAGLKEGLVTITVADNGNGIPESVDFENSTGFGLVLVNGLALQLNGTVRIERTNGTRIILEFPTKSA